MALVAQPEQARVRPALGPEPLALLLVRRWGLPARVAALARSAFREEPVALALPQGEQALLAGVRPEQPRPGTSHREPDSRAY